MTALSKAKLVLFFALAASPLLIANCGKARYKQVKPPVAGPPVAPRQEPMGPLQVRPGPPAPPRGTTPTQAPPTNDSGEQRRPPAEAPLEIIELPDERPRQMPPDRADADWMDPSHYGGGRQSPPPPAPPRPLPLPVPQEDCGSKCFTGSYTQPTTLGTDKLDILFVVDSSASIRSERVQAAQGIERFIGSLPVGTDINIGVLAGHGPEPLSDGRPSFAGRLVTIGSEPAVLSTARHGNQVQAFLHEKLTRVPGHLASDGGELGLYSLDRAITGPQLQALQAEGMLRPDAALAVIFMSDENDICSLGSYPQGQTPKPDPSIDRATGRPYEQQAFERHCGGVTPESVYNKLLRVKAGQDGAGGGDGVTRPILLSAIVYLQTPAPGSVPGDRYENENERGYGYLDIVALNNGVAIDIGSGDIPASLSRIGQMAFQRMALKTEFMIHDPHLIDPNSVEVSVDGRRLCRANCVDAEGRLTRPDFVYHPHLKQVHLASGGRAGSLIQVRWCSFGDPNVGQGGRVLHRQDSTQVDVQRFRDSYVERRNGRTYDVQVDVEIETIFNRSLIVRTPYCDELRSRLLPRRLPVPPPLRIPPPRPPREQDRVALPAPAPPRQHPVVPPTSGPQVEPRPRHTRDMLCADIRALVQRSRKIHLPGAFGSRDYYAEPQDCPGGAHLAQPSRDVSKDQAACFYGYVCNPPNQNDGGGS